MQNVELPASVKRAAEMGSGVVREIASSRQLDTGGGEHTVASPPGYEVGASAKYRHSLYGWAGPLVEGVVEIASSTSAELSVLFWAEGQATKQTAP